MLNKIKRILTQLLMISTLIEIFIYPDFKVLWAVLVIQVGWFLINNLIITPHNLLRYPVTFLMFFGLGFFHFILPIPLTLIELKPVTFNLILPFETFLHHLLFTISLVLTFLIYKAFMANGNPLIAILKRTNFYQPPSNREIWQTSIIAAAFSFYFYIVYGAWENTTERSLMMTLGQTMAIFLWMPMIIPFYKIRQISQHSSKRTNFFIIGYFFLIVVLSIVSNWRTILYMGIFIFVALYFIGIMYGHYSFSKLFTWKRFVILSFIIYIISGPIMNLGVAMIVTRQTRYYTNSTEFFRNTIDVYENTTVLEQFEKGIVKKEKGTLSQNTWDEEYLNNYLLNRFCNLKISDNCIYYANKTGYANPKMQEVLNKQVIEFIPSFFRKYLDIKSENEEIKSSITDNLYSIAINDASVKGSAIIGSMPGVGLSIFGYWYLLIIIPIFFIIFAMFDSFAIVVKDKVYFSYFFFTILITALNFFNDRHVFQFELRWILRNYLESIIIFLFVMGTLRFFNKLWFRDKTVVDGF